MKNETIVEAFKFYYKATALKEMLRQGAIKWNVSKERIESVAEHTFGCMILAIALHSQLKIDINLADVLEMLTIHELEEIAIGDITPTCKTDTYTNIAKAKQFVKEITENLEIQERLISLTNDFNNKISMEAKFAYAIDKLECVLEFNKYQKFNMVSLDNVTNEMLENEQFKKLYEQGKYDVADIFFLFHKNAYEPFGINYDFWKNNLKNLEIDNLYKPYTYN